MLTGENIDAVEGVVSQLHPPSQDRMVQDFRCFAIFLWHRLESDLRCLCTRVHVARLCTSHSTTVLRIQLR